MPTHETLRHVNRDVEKRKPADRLEQFLESLKKLYPLTVSKSDKYYQYVKKKFTHDKCTHWSVNWDIPKSFLDEIDKLCPPDRRALMTFGISIVQGSLFHPHHRYMFEKDGKRVSYDELMNEMGKWLDKGSEIISRYRH